MRRAARVLMDGDQARHAAALHVFAAHGVAGALGRDHDHVDIGGRLDQAEVDVEAVSKGERRAGLHVALDVILPDRRLMFIGREDHDEVGPLRGRRVGQHLEAGRFDLLGSRRTFAQGDGDFGHAAVAQVLRMGMALRAIADNRDLLGLDQIEIGIGVVVDFHFFFLVIPAKAGTQFRR